MDAFVENLIKEALREVATQNSLGAARSELRQSHRILGLVAPPVAELTTSCLI